MLCWEDAHYQRLCRSWDQLLFTDCTSPVSHFEQLVPTYISWLKVTGEASLNDAHISVSLLVDMTQDLSCDVALVGIPHYKLTSKVERAPQSFHPILCQFFIKPPVLAKYHHDSTSV